MFRFSNSYCIASYFEAEIKGSEVTLLPFGHARHFPLSFRMDSRKILKGELNFFNSVFYKNFDPNNFISPENCQAVLNKNGMHLLILNALDNCFGHALLKLFFCIQYNEQREGKEDVLLIIPSSLRHFIKSRPGLNLLFVDQSFLQLERCYVLNKEIAKITNAYETAFLVGTETYASFDPEILKKNLNLFGNSPETCTMNRVIFYYRKDYFRTWSGKAQARRIIKLFGILREFFDESIIFCVVGDLDEYKFPPWIKDERIVKFSPEADFKYNSLFASSRISIGLTGSHMLFPSLFSQCTIHLHPSQKYKNMAEDVIVKTGIRRMTADYEHLYYFGNYNCSDLYPDKLAILVASHYQGLLEKEYKTGISGTIGQKDWLRQYYPFFKLEKVVAYRQKFLNKENNKARLRYYLDRLLKLIR